MSPSEAVNTKWVFFFSPNTDDNVMLMYQKIKRNTHDLTIIRKTGKWKMYFALLTAVSDEQPVPFFTPSLYKTGTGFDFNFFGLHMHKLTV